MQDCGRKSCHTSARRIDSRDLPRGATNIEREFSGAVYHVTNRGMPDRFTTNLDNEWASDRLLLLGLALETPCTVKAFAMGLHRKSAAVTRRRLPRMLSDDRSAAGGYVRTMHRLSRPAVQR